MWVHVYREQHSTAVSGHWTALPGNMTCEFVGGGHNAVDNATITDSNLLKPPISAHMSKNVCFSGRSTIGYVAFVF